MRLAILGGSFDPAHRGHIALAEAAADELGFDRVLLIPSATAPHKKAPFASDKDRLAMLSAAIVGNRRLSVDDCEIRRGGVSYTIDTVRDVAERYRPKGRIGLIVGDDLAAGFPSWRSPDELARIADIVLARRDPSSAAAFAYPHRTLANAPLPVSSSAVRMAIAAGGSWRDSLPPMAARILEDRKLYGFKGGGKSCGAVPFPEGEGAGAPVVSAVESRAWESSSVKRFLHARSVALFARCLCVRWGCDPEKGYLAGIAHDLCKEMPVDAMEATALRDGSGRDALEKAKPSLLHARAAAVLLREEFGVADSDVLEAVRMHTFADAGLGKLAKIIYIADKIEALRPDVESGLRAFVAESSLEDSFARVLRDTAAYLRVRGRIVSPASERALSQAEKVAAG